MENLILLQNKLSAMSWKLGKLMEGDLGGMGWSRFLKGNRMNTIVLKWKENTELQQM